MFDDYYVSENFKQNKQFFFKFVPLTFFLFSTAFLMLLFPGIVTQGVKNGIDICLEQIIPSLFPLMFVFAVIFNSGIFDFLAGSCNKISEFLFNLPGKALPIIIMSVLGGYPLGAFLTVEAVNNGKLTQQQGRKMMLFCVNPGPAFVISAVGYTIIGSEKTGLILFVAVTASSLISGVVLRFFTKKFGSFYVQNEKSFCDFGAVMTKSVDSTVKSMLNICFWIVTFSCISSMLENLITDENVSLLFNLTGEVTKGVTFAAEKMTLPIVASVLSFGGFCVHLQIVPYLGKLKLEYYKFFFARVFSALLSGAITFVLLKVFPQEKDVISVGTVPGQIACESPFPVCVWFLLFCGIFMIGDSYRLTFRKSRKY